MMFGLTSVFAAAGLVLQPWGPVPELTQSGKPWSAFSSSDPVCFVVRAQKVQLTEGATCESWAKAIQSGAEVGGQALGAQPDAKAWESAWKSQWEPWSEKEADEIRDCDEQPCLVKLSDSEVEQMAKFPKKARVEKYLSLIAERSMRYAKTGERKGYEFNGEPVEPWSFMEKKGMKTPLARPEAPSLYLRRFNFAPGKIKALHQVLDRRVATSSDGKNATVWIRDAYTDHYFDSWGEWIHFDCSTQTLVHGLVLEFDTLKMTGLFAGVAKSKARSAVEENGKRFLDDRFKLFEKKAK